MPDRSHNSPRIAIVGAGMSGLCMAIRLKSEGFDSFVIFEKSASVGGTWAENTYPNAGCDIPSFLYSYSFVPKFDWTQKFARQPEILQYFRDCSQKFEIDSHIRFQTEIESASYDESTAKWSLKAGDGSFEEFDFFISAVGQLNRPAIPEFEGADQFQGTTFHSAQWDHTFDPMGKKVAVVGTGASAIQFLPELAEKASRLTIFQRSPNWVTRLKNFRYSKFSKATFRAIPLVARLHRFSHYAYNEGRFSVFKHGSLSSWAATSWMKLRIKLSLKEPLRSEVTPDYPLGCKRILMANDFYDTLERENVDLVTDPIRCLTEKGIATDDCNWDADAVIYATGFQTSNFLAPMEIIGRCDQSLAKVWAEKPGAYLGMMIQGFPNFFVLYGPNTNLGHNSIIYMVECQVNYIIKCMKLLSNAGAQAVEVTSKAAVEFQEMVQRRQEGTVYSSPKCTSWYKRQDGTILNNWCGGTLEYGRRTRRPNAKHLHLVTTKKRTSFKLHEEEKTSSSGGRSVDPAEDV